MKRSTLLIGALLIGGAGGAALYAWKRRLPTLWDIPAPPSRAIAIDMDLRGEASGWRPAAPVPSIRIMYVGHSLIGPDIPVMSKRIAESLGVEFDFSVQLIDGGSLEVNWNHPDRAAGDARLDLATGEYDALLLTEAVNLDDHLRWSSPATYAARWASLARSHRSDARLFFYETWHDRSESRFRLGVRHGDTWRENLDRDLGRWEHIVDRAEARDPSLHFDIVPGGQSLAALVDAIDTGEVPGVRSVDALFHDTIHPSPLGAYFMSLVHVSTLTRRSPLGAARVVPTGNGADYEVPEPLADALQRIAWEAVRAYPRSGVLRPE